VTSTETQSVTADYDEQLRQLAENETKHRDEMKAILAAAKDDTGLTRGLDDDEKTRFDAADTALTQFEERRAQLEKLRDREVAAAEQTRKFGLQAAYVTSEEAPYTRTSSMNGGASYIRDLYRAKKGDSEAYGRLRRNDQHVAAYNTRAGLTTVNGAGGELVPPLWLEEDWIKYVRPGRKTANLCVNAPLPGGTDSINIPKINTGSAVAFQGTQNTGINETDLTTTSVSAGVYTAAGGQTLSIQLVEQSPVNIDMIVMQDLAADYARFVDAAVVLNGSGASQPTGVLNLAGTNTVTFTSASPTVGGTGANAFYPKIANAVQQIEARRFAAPTHIIMHPARWAWILSGSDSSNRPLVVPSGANYNPVGTSGNPAAEGVVGEMLGLPVITDANIPTNLGAGTNQDVVIVAKFDDLFLWEGKLQADVFPQTYAANASLYARLYNYVAFQPARYPQSISLITGTGLITPTF
jgi:HK97 family phage major capsid protein